MDKGKKIIGSAAFVLCFALLFSVVSGLLQDKRVQFFADTTNKIKGFYNEPKDSLDFVFVGSSQVYCNVAPAVLWKEYGITSYDFASNEQPFWISYFYIKELLKTQSPKAVLLEITYSIAEHGYAPNGINRVNIDDIPFSLNKLEMIKTAVPEENRAEFYLPFLLYHQGWEHLTEDNFLYADSIYNPYKGYSPIISNEKYPDDPDESYAQTTEYAPLFHKTEEYLFKIIELSRQEGFELVLFKTPESNPERQPYYNTVQAIAEEQGIRFINYNTIMSGEGHMDIARAEEFTTHLGNWLVQEFAPDDKRENPEYAYWHQDNQYFYTQLNNRYLVEETELANYLRLVSFRGYRVIFTVYDDGFGGIEGQAIEALEALGLEQPWQDAFRCSFIAVIDNGEVIYQALEPGSQEILLYLQEQKLYVRSEGGIDATGASIRIDDTEYSLGRRGMNIVVYDTLLETVVDSVSVETSGSGRLHR